MIPKTLFYKLHPDVDGAETDQQQHPDSLVAMESANIIIAGGGTTAIALTYVVYAVLLDTRIRDKLVREIAQVESPSFDELDKIPYLKLGDQRDPPSLQSHTCEPTSYEPRLVVFYYGAQHPQRDYSQHSSVHISPRSEYFRRSRSVIPPICSTLSIQG